MKELNDIILAYENAVLQNKRTALVTVVKVEGSSYRRPGARMLVTEDGEVTGAISGGCLEGDALRKAQFCMFEQKNRLEIYDTTDDEEHTLGVQLGCNGIVYILFEPVKNDSADNPVNLLKKVSETRTDAVLITAFNLEKSAPQVGTCCFVSKHEASITSQHIDVLTEGKAILQQQISVVKESDDQSILYQFVPPSIQLIIVGAGNDVQPLAEMASLLGWDTIIADGRPSYATAQRFLKANKVCVVKPQELLSIATIDSHTAIVLMTHNYNYDIAALEQLIHTNCAYIGILGPKKKLHKMLDELTAKSISMNDNAAKRIYAPVGLDIGAETSEEIALSIIAEIKAVFSKREGTFLKERKMEIHERSVTFNND